MSARPGSEGPLGPALKLAGQKHVGVLAFRVPAFLAQALDERSSRMSPVVQFLKPAFEAKSGTAVLDGNEQSIRLHARLRYADADTAQQAEDAIKVGMNMLRQQLASALPPESQWGRAVAKLFQAVSHALRTAKVTRQDAVVDIRLESKAIPVLTSALPALIEVRKSADRMNDANSLKQLGLAMHNYYLDHNRFPAHAIYSKDGKPLLSWRVAILPYIEQGNLYNQFHLDEPWDSDHNKRLLRRMPITYRPLQGKAGPFETFYQVFTGKQTMFPPGKNGSRFPDITDGTAGTLMIAEAAKAVPWTKPEDLPYSPDKPLPRLGGEFENGSNAAFADGSVHWIPKNIDPKMLRALITANGGERIDRSKLERSGQGQ